MRILVVGAAGNAGSRIVTEALIREHHVTAASRRPRSTTVPWAAPILALDAADPAQVRAAAENHDVVIGATRPAAGREQDVVACTRGLAEGARRAGARLAVVGGAAPLLVPGTTRRALDDPAWVPEAVRPIAAASARQLEVLHNTPGSDWIYLAPAAMFTPGERTGAYRTAGRDLVIADDGTSSVSMEDFAIAVLDEVERPTAYRDVVSVGR